MHLKLLAKKHVETRFVKLDVERAPFLTGKLIPIQVAYVADKVVIFLQKPLCC